MKIAVRVGAALDRVIPGLVAVAILAAASPVLAADFYTSPSGVDTNACTSAASPCKTIQAAVGKAAANDTVHVGQGNYPFSNQRIVIDKAGLKLIGDNSPFDAASVPGAPVKAADASVLQAASGSVSGTSGMIWVKNVANVEVRNLYIELSGGFSGTKAKEGVVATGAIDGSVIDNNFIKIGGSYNTKNIGISINLPSGNDSSVPSGETRTSGQFVTISNNAIVPDTASYAVPKRAIAMQNSVGTVSGNQVAGSTQDMWIQSPSGGSAHHILTISGNWFFGGLQLYVSSGSSLQSTVIDGNHFTAPPSSVWGNGSEAHSLRVMGANGGSPTVISNNEFTGFGGVYRALWVMSRPKVTIEANTFTPAAAQSDFTAIVVGNREVWNGLPAPNAYDVVIRANTFNANAAAAGNKAKAILFVDDNDPTGAATFTSAIVGGENPADANSFDTGIGWYIALDDRSCTGNNHNVTGGGCNGSPSYAIGQGIAYSGGSNKSSQKRPFKWDVQAAGNRFGGVYMPVMTQGQYNAVWAKTYDKHDATDSSVGNVVYGYPSITTGTITFSPTNFTYDGNAHAITASLDGHAEVPCVVTPDTVTDTGTTNVSATCANALYNVTGTGNVVVAKLTGTVVWGTLNFTYDTSAHAVTASLAEDNAAICTVTPSSVTDAGDTAVHADCAGANYTASADETAHVAKATGTVVWGTLNFTYDASAHVITASLQQDNAAICTVTPSSVTNAGDTPVHADCAGSNYTGSADTTAHVAKANGTVVWDPLNFTYDASAHAITASLSEDNAATCTVTPSSVTNAGDTPVHANCAGANYTASADATAHVAKATGTVVWGTLNFTYDASTHAITASLQQDNAATCTVTPSSVTDAGDTPVHADCVGTNYTASADATAHVAKATGTVVWGTLNFTYDASAHVITASLQEDNAAICTVTPPSVTDAGDTAVHADCAGANYSASADETAHVAKAAQSIMDFAADPANPVYSDGGSFTLSATAGASGETVTFASTTVSVCTVAGNTVTMLSIGTCTLTADQAGNTNYDAASQVTLDVTISAPPQPDLAVSIDAGRDFVQYGKLLTYTITVQNNGNATANANVAAAVPSTLMDGSWICSANTIGAACGAAVGTGDLNDNGAVIPKDGQLVYTLTATVNDDPGLTADQITETAMATVNGTPADSNPSDNSATANTQIVIFRSGFEQGGDGAQKAGAALNHPAGSLDEVATLMLDPDAAPQALNTPTPWLRATDAAGHEVFRIDTLRSADDVLVRVISSDANGHESHSDWIGLGTQTVGLALASTSPSAHSLIVLNANDAGLQVAIPSWATLPLGVYSAQ